MNKKIFNKDQTVFVDEAPLWQTTSQNKIDLKDNLARNKNLRPFYFLMAGVFLLFAVYIVLIFIPKKEEISVVFEPLPEKEVLEANPLQKRVRALQEDLKVADPTRQTLAFPNVNLKISFP